MEKKYNEIIEKIEKLSVLELSQLIKALEEKFGVSAASAMVSASATPEKEETASAEEKTSFSVELKNAGQTKIQVIKVIKDILGIGLKEAKDVVDAAPKVIKENMNKADAEEMKKKLEEAGAAVELK